MSAEETKRCVCPYCEAPLPLCVDFCKTCQIELICCPHCRGFMRPDARICPHCGGSKDEG